MSKIKVNSSHVYTTVRNNQSHTTSTDIPLIVGLTTRCFIAVAIVICICYCLARKYELCPGGLKKKKKKKETIPLSIITTVPNVLPTIVAHNPPGKELPLVKHDKPKIVADVPNPKSFPSVHHKKPCDNISKPCSQAICKQYSINNLKMNRVYFNFYYNKCFCPHCYPTTKTDFFTVANSNYTVPRHWTRFGLQIDETFATSKQIFKQWYTTFYGTSKDKLESIINNRFIPIPGDHLLSGKVFATHLSDKHHVYTSPSIHYACLRHVCPVDIVNINNEWYDVQIVLECKQNPEGIVKQKGYRHNVCDIISDNEIEWKTDRRASIIPYGLLIRARKHRCTRECTNIHS